MKGVVTYINQQKQFGFIEDEYGVSVFFHFSKVIGRSQLGVGDIVEVATRPSTKRRGRLEAEKIKMASDQQEYKHIAAISWFDNEKGFGVARSIPSGKEIFLHKKGFIKPMYLSEENLVEFILFQKKGKDKPLGIQKADENLDNIFLLNGSLVSLETVTKAFKIANAEERRKIIYEQITTGIGNRIISYYLREEFKRNPNEFLNDAIELLIQVKPPVYSVYYWEITPKIQKSIIHNLLQLSNSGVKLKLWHIEKLHKDIFAEGVMYDMESDLTLRLDDAIQAYSFLTAPEKEELREKLLEMIPPRNSRKTAKERAVYRSTLDNFFNSFQDILKALPTLVRENKHSRFLEYLNGAIREYLVSVFPIDSDQAFQKALPLLSSIQTFQECYNYLKESEVPFFNEIELEWLPNNECHSTLVFQNSSTPYNLKFWVQGLIDEFDYNSYCYYYFLLTTSERKKFNKKARAVMGEAIKTSMLKKREPWELMEEGEEGINSYTATWKSIWFKDGLIEVCTSTSSEPEFTHPWAWDFSEEEMNFLYDYISGKRLSPLTIQARGKLILQIDGLDELEEVIYKAELEREVKTGKGGDRKSGANRIPINMILRNKCIQYLNLLQLEGLEPTRLLERSYNPEKKSFYVHLALLFSIPLPTGEVALIWESLELEKAKATHVFKCAASEHEDIQNQIEDYLSRKDKVRSSLSSNAPADLSTQRRLRYHGRVDHDNFDFAIWQERLHSLLPEMEPVELLEQE